MSQARQPGPEKPKPKPRAPWLDAIGHPRFDAAASAKHGQVIRPPAHDPIANAQARAAAPRPAPVQLDPEVVSRQRLLRAHGYGISVDGVWGPQSMSAWSSYLAQRNKQLAPKAKTIVVPKPPSNLRPKPAVDDARRVAVEEARAHVEAQVNLLAARRQLAKMHGLALTSAAIDARIGKVASVAGPTATGTQQLAVSRELRRTVDAAVKARAKPPEKMTTAELVATTVDPVTGKLDPNQPGEVRRVQRWLAAHGQKVAIDGVYGPATNAALITAFKQYRDEQHHQQVQTLVDRFYKTGAVVAGEQLGPLAHAPKPGELLEILQGRGSSFTSRRVWLEMNRRLEQAQPVYTQFVVDQLAQVERELRGPFHRPDFVKRTIQSRFVDLTVGAASAMGEQAAASFTTQLGALITARNAGDLTRRLDALKQQAEAEMAAHAKQKMGDKSFWGDVWGATKEAAGVAALPAHWLVSGVESVVFGVGDTIKHPEDAAGLRRSRDESERTDKRVAEFQKEHPWIELGLEAAFDPMWLVKPVELAGQGIQLGTLAAARMERLGYALEAGKVTRLVSPVLIAPAEHLQRFQLIARSVRELPAVNGPHSVAMKLLGQKQLAVAAVRNRVRTLRRHDFIPAGSDVLGRGPKLGQLRRDLDESGPVLRSELDKIAPDVAKSLADEGLAIFSDLDRTGDTVIGGQLRGRLHAAGAASLIQTFAVEEAHLAYVGLLYGSQPLVDLLRREHLSGAIFDAVYSGRLSLERIDGDLAASYRKVIAELGDPIGPAASRAEAKAAGQEAFQEAMSRGTQHLVAGGDQLVEDTIGWRLRRLGDDVADVLSQTQTRVEELHAARAERVKADLPAGAEPPAPLYDEAGKLVNRGGESTKLALEAAAESFDQAFTVPNRAAGVAHTADQMLSLRNAELERRIRQLKYRIGRKAGEDIASNEDARAQAILDEIDQAWEHVPGEGFYDRRPELEASPMHVRHLADAFRKTGALAALDGLPDKLRNALSAANVGGRQTALEQQLDRIAFFLTRSRSMSGWDLALTRGQYDFVIRDLSKDSADWQEGRAFRRALLDHTANLDLAADYTLPKEMLKEWAVWEALQHAQTKPLQILHKGLSAYLDAWLLLTLPLRPGFAVRNVIDNTSKMLAAGAIDPRYYFIGASRPGENLGRALSIFDLGVQQMRYVLSLGGRYQLNPALHYFDRLLNTFWDHSSDVIGRIFAAHQIDVPEAAIKAMQNDPNPGAADSWISTARGKVWHLMAAAPENFAKRSLYRHTYAKAISDGATPMEAFNRALEKIEFTLFDYAKGSVLEDNLRLIFPFLQYWRRTANFWVTTAVEKPALPLALGRYEDYRDQAHADLPEWMRRYVSIDPATNVLARVPGLEWMIPGLQDGLQTDPINLFSFGVLYRSFKNENPELPPDKAGWKFLAPIADAVNSWGISFNPLIRKPLELAGVFNFRAWQSMFPETSLVQALSADHLKGRFGGAGFNPEAWVEDKVLGLIGDGPFVQQRIADGFNQWVQLEMSAQAERGEQVSRTTAEQKIRDYYLAQTLLSFFGGVWARRRDAADIYLYKVAEELHSDPAAFNKLSAKDQHAYRIFAKRKLDPLAFDRYLETLPAVEAYYSLHGDWDRMQEFKQRHPEVLPYVSRSYKGAPFSDSFVKNAPLLADTDAAFRLFRLASELDVAHDTRALAEAAFVSPELKAFWDANDTPRQTRDKMLKGEFFRVMNRMNETFFAIPAKDFAARDGFLKAHPILGHWWNLNNSHADDLRTVLNSTNATLRDHYFRLLDGKDYAGARELLHRFPFIFEFTDAADRVDANGNWKDSGGHHHGMSQHGRDYLQVKPFIGWWFNLLRSNRAAATKWLNSNNPNAKLLAAFFKKYGHHGNSQHGRDYLKVKPYIGWWFKLLARDPHAAEEWLHSDNPKAKQLAEFFKKYAHPGGSTQHGRDFLKIKPTLLHYFKLRDEHKEDEARAFLDKHPELSAYFKKYGHFSKGARNWKDPIHSDDPEINRRLAFWQAYWSLTPDARPGFIAEHAEKDGIFIYGDFGQAERERELHDYLIEAHRHHLTEKAALYLRIRPLLDVYFTLKAGADKDLFLRANPDVQEYLDKFATHPSTGDKELDGLLERYFKFDRHSFERAAMIEANPQLQAYFDSHSSPADVAIRDVLEVYFKLPVGKKRKDFSAEHPEISVYFDKRRQERDTELGQAMSFDLADPRLQGLLDEAWINSGLSAQRVALSLRRGVAENKYGDALEIRRADGDSAQPDKAPIRR